MQIVAQQEAFHSLKLQQRHDAALSQKPVLSQHMWAPRFLCLPPVYPPSADAPESTEATDSFPPDGRSLLLDDHERTGSSGP